MQIYKTINLLNNKIYIGQDSYNKLNYFGSGVYLKRALEKYGKENFTKEILENNIENQEQLDFLEEFWIEFFDSTNSKIGYNISKKALGIHKGFKHSKESKQKLSNSKKGKFIHTKKSKEKIGISHLGFKYTKESRNKMSQSQIGKKRHTKDSKLKISKIHKNKIISEETKNLMSKSKLNKKCNEKHKRNISLSKLKLSEEQVKKIIKLLYENKLNFLQIGKLFNVCSLPIFQIQHNISIYNKLYNIYFKDNSDHPYGYKYSRQQIQEVYDLLKENKFLNKEIEKITKIDLFSISQIKNNKSCYNKIYNLYF